MIKLKLYKAESRIGNIFDRGYIFYPMGLFTTKEVAKEVAEKHSESKVKREAKVTDAFLKVFENYEDYVTYQNYAKKKQAYKKLSREEKDILSLNEDDIEKESPRILTDIKLVKNKTLYRPVWFEYNELNENFEKMWQNSYFLHEGAAKRVAFEKAKETNGKYGGAEEVDAIFFESVQEHQKYRDDTSPLKGLGLK